MRTRSHVARSSSIGLAVFAAGLRWQKSAAYLALAFGGFLAIAETARNWGDWQFGLSLTSRPEPSAQATGT